MTTPQELSPEEIRKLSRETHVNLGKKLYELKNNPPPDAENLKVLKTEASRLMRELFQYHLSLYVASGHRFDPNFPFEGFVINLDKFVAFRKELMSGDFWFLHRQKSPDRQWVANGDLWDTTKPTAINHGWIVFRREGANDPRFNFNWTKGDIHEPYTWDHLITSFIPGVQTTFIMGTTIQDQDGSSPERAFRGHSFKGVPKGTDQYMKPKVTISETGEVTF